MSKLIIHILFPIFLISQTWVTSVSPTQNKVGVSKNEIIIITFDRELNPASASDSTIVVTGNIRGYYKSKSIIYNSLTKSITYTPSQPFYVGEKIQAIVTKKVKDNNGNEMPRSFVW